jgi:UDP-N-acetylmuramate dehydrogenase
MKGITEINGQDSAFEDHKLGRAPLSVSEKAEPGHLPYVLKIMGGEYWDDVVAFACERGLTGIEALSKIPGLAGAAPVQNIGAYGQEIADTLTEIEVYDTADQTYKTLTKSDLNFSYRKSILNSTSKNRYFVISITLTLHKGEMSRPFYNSIEQYIATNNITDFSPQSIRDIVSTIRANKLPDPLEQASAGSFFKNIYLDDASADAAENKGYQVYRGKDGNKINSGWLIEQAGLKGKLLHGIRVSDKAALILINESAKSYADLAKARSEITAKVYDKFGFWLEQEPVELQ